MSTQHTHTIQVWPSGRSYEYTGDPLSGAAWKTRPSGKPDVMANPWTDAHCIGGHWREVQTELQARRIQDREILKCDSSLVADMLGSALDLPGQLGDEWTVENLTNLYPDPSGWDSVRCRAWLSDYGIDWNYSYIDTENWDARAMRLDDELRELVSDNAEPAEIFEWWAVTDWLADKLDSIGEPVLSNSYGRWWGRTCSGQSLIMDGTLQLIAKGIDKS